MNVTFEDYWTKAKNLTLEQRKDFFSSFSASQQKQIKKSYLKDGWKDLFLRNYIDHLSDEIRRKYEIDLFDIRIRILMKKERILISRRIWDEICDQFLLYDACCDLSMIFGDVSSKIYALDPYFYELYKKE